MNHHAVRKSTLVCILALVLGACSGSGSGSGPGSNPLGDVDGGGQVGSDNNGGLSVTIASPAAEETLETPDDSVSLAGTATGSAEIVSVSWTTDKGSEGTATGSEAWETSPIPLQVGENSITVVAKDKTGATATDTVVVIRESGTTGSVTLSWTAPTEREDGTPLLDLTGYRIHYGRMSETYDYKIEIDNPGIVSYVVDNLDPGKWYFVAQTYDSAGLESNFSNEVSKKIK